MMKTKVLVIFIITICLLVIGAIAVLASPDNTLGYDDVYSTTPVSMSADEGVQIIKEKFPSICTDLKFMIYSWNRDKSIQWLEYSSKEADFRLNSKTKDVDMLIMLELRENETASIDIKTAQEIAMKYISEYRPDYDLTKMQQTESGFVDQGAVDYYRFEWRELRDDVDIGNAINIELFPNGDFKSYVVVKPEALDIKTNVNKLTNDQAVDIVKKHLASKISQDRYAELKINDSKLVIFNHKISWVVEMSSQPAGDPVTYYYRITIDAQSGEVLDDVRG